MNLIECAAQQRLVPCDPDVGDGGKAMKHHGCVRFMEVTKMKD